MGGSVRSLSPTEGKFRVKGSGERPEGLLSLFLDRNAAQCNEDRRFAVVERHSSGLKSFFAWQNGCDYRECALIKAPLFWQNQSPEPRNQGTAPDDDPARWRTVASVRNRGAGQLAGADHFQLAAFRLGLPGRIPRRLADRPAGAAPLRRFLHGRVDRGPQRPWLSHRPGPFPALL